MENTLKKHLIQTQLNEKLRLLIEAEGLKDIDEITNLLQKGADPNCRPRFQDSLICSVLCLWPLDSQAIGIELLTSFGANVNLPDSERRTALSGCLRNTSQLQIQKLLLSKGAVPIEFSIKDFEPSEANCRYGCANPEKVTDPFFDFMIATGEIAFKVRKSSFTDMLDSGNFKDFEKNFGKDLEELTGNVKEGKLSGEAAAGFFNYIIHGEPKWCNNRYGISYHFLKDGTLIQIGGEHEDFCDEDFNIYNDVIRIAPNGKVELFFYPEHIFPPTDFHSSTKLGNEIIIIGGLGYQKDRVAGQTNMHILNLDNFSIKSMSSKGDKPGWIFEHTTLLDEQNHCLYLMDGKKWVDGKIVENKDTYTFELKKRRWSRNK